MKKLAILFLMLTTGVAEAFEAGNKHFQLGGGVGGTIGVLGLGSDIFFTENNVLSLGLGIDHEGFGSSAGYKFYGPSWKTNSLFIPTSWEQKTHVYAGIALKYIGALEYVKSDTAYAERSEIYKSIASVGVTDTYKNGFSTSLEVNYNYRLNQPKYELLDPSESLKDRKDKEPAQHWGLNITLGYVF